MIDRKKIIIFDFDNTIIESLPLCFTCFRIVFEKFRNISMSDLEIETFFGGSEEGIIKKIVGEKKAEEGIELFYALYTDFHDDLIVRGEIFFDVVLMLKKLKEKGKRLAIFTGKGRKSIEISLEKLNLNEYFDFIVSDDDVCFSKPNSEGILKVLDYFNAKEEEVVFIGDSDADILAAKGACVQSIGVNWYSKRNFITIPDFISDHPSDLFKCSIRNIL